MTDTPSPVETAHRSIHWLPALRDEAIAAYQADVAAGTSDAASFTAWASTQIVDFTRLPLAKRARLLRDAPAKPAGRGKPATLRLSQPVIDQVDDLIAADEEQTGVTRSFSTVVVDACRVGAERARINHHERTGDNALPAPQPLPRGGNSTAPRTY